MRKEWGEGWKNPANAGDKAEAYRAGHEVVNDVLESEIGSKNPDAGRAWRTTGQKEASAILARDSAERALGRSQQRGLGWRDASAAAVGAQASESTPGKIIGGLAGVAGRMLFAGRQHAVAATAAEGLQAAGRIAGTVGGPVARFVRQTPVERAASLKAARDHYLRSSTDPDYNKKNYGTQ